MVSAFDGGLLGLPKIGRIPIWLHRPLEGDPKTVTVSKEADGWYTCFSRAECADTTSAANWAGSRHRPRNRGVRYAVQRHAHLPSRLVSQSRTALKTAQRRVSRRKKGSNRRRKAVNLLAKAHQRVRRQRMDFHHKTALALVRANDAIYHEDLQTANMLRNHHLAKSIQDAGWSAFLSILSFKAVCAGRSVVAVPPAYTSQICSGCGVMVSKGLSVRWHSCPDCGTSLHRDHNAAKNIERLGQSRRGGVAVAAAENREAPLSIP